MKKTEVREADKYIRNESGVATGEKPEHWNVPGRHMGAGSMDYELNEDGSYRLLSGTMEAFRAIMAQENAIHKILREGQDYAKSQFASLVQAKDDWFLRVARGVHREVDVGRILYNPWDGKVTFAEPKVVRKGRLRPAGKGRGKK